MASRGQLRRVRRMNLSTPASYASFARRCGISMFTSSKDELTCEISPLARLVGTGCRFVVLSNHVHDGVRLGDHLRDELLVACAVEHRCDGAEVEHGLEMAVLHLTPRFGMSHRAV